jgi:S1-C subfamily serine protease
MKRLIVPLVCWEVLLGAGAVFGQKPALGFRCVETRNKTVEITYVDPKGLASQMGLEKGDILYELNKVKIKTIADMEEALKGFPGKYQLTVERTREGRKTTRALEGELKKSEKQPDLYYVIPKKR